MSKYITHDPHHMIPNGARALVRGLKTTLGMTPCQSCTFVSSATAIDVQQPHRLHRYTISINETPMLKPKYLPTYVVT